MGEDDACGELDSRPVASQPDRSGKFIDQPCRRNLVGEIRIGAALSEHGQRFAGLSGVGGSQVPCLPSNFGSTIGLDELPAILGRFEALANVAAGAGGANEWKTKPLTTRMKQDVRRDAKDAILQRVILQRGLEDVFST